MKKLKNAIMRPLKKKYNKIIYKYSIENNEKGRSALIENKKLKNKFIIKYFLIIISFLFTLFLSFILIKALNFRYKKYADDEVEYEGKEEEEDEDDNYKPDNKSIYFEEKFYSYQEAYNKAKEFIMKNLKGELINNKKVELSNKPNISVVIPCCNCKKYILRAIRSIQNQDLSNFEIIIANDGSKDDTLTYIEELQKEESRIRIISNKINKGTLYTRSIATLSANGKYIIPMDSDDMFLDKDVFSVLTNTAYKGNFDIVIYNTIYTDLKPDVYTAEVEPTIFDFNHKPNLVLFQPDLDAYIYRPTDNIENIYPSDVLLHGKLFKTKIYKKALKRLGKEKYSRFMILVEDDLASNIIFNTANSAKFIAKYGYLYINNEGSFSKRKQEQTQEVRNYLYLLDPLIDFSLDLPRNKKVLVNFIIFLFQKEYLKVLLDFEYDNKVFNSCLDRILNCKYISDELKDEIRIRGKKLGFIKYKF